MVYRILIGVDGQEHAATLRARFSELPDCSITAIEHVSGDLTSSAAADAELDVVLIDEQLGPLPALDVIRDITLRQPHLGLVLLVGEVTLEVSNRAMEAGVRGVLGVNSSVEELNDRVIKAAAWTRRMRSRMEGGALAPIASKRANVVALAGAKGGTGTTLLTVQLAMAAIASGETVCIVDLDLQTGDIPTYLDLTHRRSILDLVDAADDISGPILAETLFVHPSGPHVLLAPSEGERAEDVTARVTRQAITALRTRYDVLLIDCGSHMSDASATGIEFADKVLLTVTPDMPALRAGKRLTKMWSRLQVRKQDEVGVVLVKHSRNNEIQPDFARKIIGAPIMNTAVPASFRAVEAAANTGNPAALDDDGYRKTIGQLAMESGIVQPKEDPADKKRRKTDEGSAIVEFAAILPFLGLILLVVWQVVLIGLTSMYASHGADEAARLADVIGTSPKWSDQCVKRVLTPPPPHEKKVICPTWKAVHKRVLTRISAPWNDSKHVHLHLVNTGGYAVVAVDMPIVLPRWHSTFHMTAEAKIEREPKTDFIGSDIS